MRYRYRYIIMVDNFYQWLAWRLPKRLRYWCVVVSGAKATSGKYGNTILPEITFMEVLERNG